MTGDDRRIFLGLKFLILGFFWVGKFCISLGGLIKVGIFCVLLTLWLRSSVKKHNYQRKCSWVSLVLLK